MLLGDGLEGRHQQLLVVGRDVRALEHRRDLELAGRDLVVPGLGRDAQLEQLPLGVHHEAEDPLRDRTEVVVVELLALGRLDAEQGAAGVQQVGPGEEEVPVDQEVLLLGAAERHHSGRLVAEQLQHSFGVVGHRLLRRSNGVLWSSASPVIETKTVGMRRVLPFGFSSTYAGLVTSQPVYPRASNVLRSPPLGKLEASGSPWTSVLPANSASAETVADGLEEAVVLLCGEPGQRVEDVRVVGGALLQRPIFHGRRDGVGDGGIKGRSVLDGGDDRLKTDLGSRFCMTDLLKTFAPKTSPGASPTSKLAARRHIRFDISDRLQANVASCH